MATGFQYVPVVGDFSAVRGNPPNTSPGFSLVNSAGTAIPRDTTTAYYQGSARPSALKTSFALFSETPDAADVSGIFITVVSPRVPTADDVAKYGNSFSPLVTITPGLGCLTAFPYVDSVVLTAGSALIKIGLKLEAAEECQFSVCVDFSHSIE